MFYWSDNLVYVNADLYLFVECVFASLKDLRPTFSMDLEGGLKHEHYLSPMSPNGVISSSSMKWRISPILKSCALVRTPVSLLLTS